MFGGEQHEPPFRAVLDDDFAADYSGDLYGRYLRVAFVSWLRPERRFEQVDDLVRQMGEDGYNARFQLAGSRPPRDMGRTAFNQ